MDQQFRALSPLPQEPSMSVRTHMTANSQLELQLKGIQYHVVTSPRNSCIGFTGILAGKDKKHKN